MATSYKTGASGYPEPEHETDERMLRAAGSGLVGDEESRESSGRESRVSAARRGQRSRSTEPTSIRSASFNPNEEDLTTTWSSHAGQIMCVSPYVNGVAISLHPGEGEATKKQVADSEENSPRPHYLPSQFHLRLPETKNYLLPSGRYFLYRDNFGEALERRLSQLQEQGTLSSTVLYFGGISDPFLNLQRKFSVTMRCLELFENFRPGVLIMQTRSPMVISALPTLKLFKDRAAVAISIETHLESAIARYTPGMPRIEERLVAARGLRAQGVKVNLVVSPVLPYGEINRDAWEFADILAENADFVTFGSLAAGGPSDEVHLRALALSRRLAADREYRLLRPYAYRYIYQALKILAPEKLTVPSKQLCAPRQLRLFAA